MIVTRQRPKPKQYHRIFLPVVAVLLLAAALMLPPSRNFIVNGPLSGLWRAGSAGMTTAAKPFHFAELNDEITQRDRQIAALNKQLADNRAALADRDRQISSLQSQLNQTIQQAQTDRVKNAKPAAVAATTDSFASTTAKGGDLAAQGTQDMRRTANYWASMDAENAAKVVQRLPVSYVARVFALMSPDAVGQILNALPASYAAALTAEHPELRR